MTVTLQFLVNGETQLQQLFDPQFTYSQAVPIASVGDRVALTIGGSQAIYDVTSRNILYGADEIKVTLYVKQ